MGNENMSRASYIHFLNGENWRKKYQGKDSNSIESSNQKFNITAQNSLRERLNCEKLIL